MFRQDASDSHSVGLIRRKVHRAVLAELVDRYMGILIQAHDLIRQNPCNVLPLWRVIGGQVSFRYDMADSHLKRPAFLRRDGSGADCTALLGYAAVGNLAGTC